ncbi:MAG: bifunctional riboflavin kinase/FAD synthetase [Candidatus Azobacteroides sp.]|nr:bifunctional riboflavin kinase/FAD synthetase [Candidatus Azobacteroides sp.]
MKTLYANELQSLDELKSGVAATIGFFDGVHLGHRFLIEQLKDVARKAGVPSAVITFHIHPRKVLQTDYVPELLTSFEGKLHQLSTTGIDYCIVIDFTKKLSEYSACSFIQDILFEQFHVKYLIIGYDHRFGKDRVDGFDEYKGYGKAVGMEVILADPLTEEEVHHSSTAIRKMLEKGRVKDAAQLLSYNYRLKGVVVKGNGVGSKIGFPTANIDLFDKGKIIPQDGAYAVCVNAEGNIYKGMLYIGYRPTLFSKGELRLEVNIFDFSGNLYGKPILVEFIDHLREDVKFQQEADLVKQLEEDKKNALKILTQININEESFNHRS